MDNNSEKLENNQNSSKPIILSIIGIIVLIVALMGVSFAFFSYTKNAQNNSISTGEMAIYMSENSTISVSNQFPMTNNEVTSGEDENLSSVNFTITGYSSGIYNIPYRIYAIAGDTQSSPKVRFKNSEISVWLTATPGITGQTISNNLSIPTQVNSLVDSTGWLIASGIIKEGTPRSNPQVDTYNLKMFVNDTVRISDTNTTVTWNNQSLPTGYCASDRILDSETNKYIGCKVYIDREDNNTLKIAENTDSTNHEYLKTYKNLYYSLKLRVEATEGIS